MPTKSKDSKGRISIDPDDDLKTKIVKESDALDRSWAGQCQRNLKVYYEVKALLGKGDVAEEVPIVAIIQQLLKVSRDQASVLDFMTPTKLREEKGAEEPLVFRTPEPQAVERPSKSQGSSDQQKT